MRLVALVLVAASGVAHASSPGQPLDCSDLQFDMPGLTCQVLAPFGVEDCDPYYWKGGDLAHDNEGGVLIGVSLSSQQGVEIHRSTDGGKTTQRIAALRERIGPGHRDRVRFPDHRDTCLSQIAERLHFDPMNGRLVIPLVSYCEGLDCPCGTSCYGDGYGGRWIAVIEGFTTTFEILQTFTPSASLGFRVPYMPEGLPAADHFDTYYGPLVKPIDFSQAHGLQCDYPAGPPALGDYLEVADTVPTPASGQGVYYVTAVTHQGQTRYGRKANGGVLRGRDSALLGVCTSTNR